MKCPVSGLNPPNTVGIYETSSLISKSVATNTFVLLLIFLKHLNPHLSKDYKVPRLSVKFRTWTSHSAGPWEQVETPVHFRTCEIGGRGAEQHRILAARKTALNSMD